MSAEPCCVANQHCKSPANEEPARAARAKCYSCGGAVCTALGCSIRTSRWACAKGKRVRICANCAEDDPLLARQVDADIYLEAGYPEAAESIRWGRAKAQWRKHIPGGAPGEKHEKPPERVLCAAIWVDDGVKYVNQPTATGIVYGGYRHHNIFTQIVATYPTEEAAIKRDRSNEHQGFLTTWGRFVDRKEAMGLALTRGQVEKHKIIREDRLFSEDLYP